MRVLWSRVFLAGVLAVSAIDPAGAAQNPSFLSVQSGHSVVLKTPGLVRVAVGDSRIAGVLPIGTSQLVVNGKAPGQTTVFVWEGDGHDQTFNVTVTEQSMDDLAQMLRTSIDEPNVQVVSFRNSVVLRGTVADGAHYQQLADILAQFQPYATSQKDTIIDAVTVQHPLQELQKDLAAIPGANDVRVDVDNKGNVIVSGHVHDNVTAAAVLEQAKGLAGTFLSATGQLIDRMSTDEHSQVDIKVYVLEVDRTAESNLGLSLQSATFNNNGTYSLGTPSFPAVESPQPPGGALKIGAFFRTITLAPTLNLLLSQGHVRILSSPDLVTTPGNLATFLVGGSFPIPYSTGLGQTSVQYEPYGVQLNVTPTLLGNGDVESKITPDVSNLDFADAIQENGFLIPALKESKISTDVITQPGQSIIMGGMVQRIEQKTIQKIPLLGDIPILGELFRSTQYQNNQSDVVFVMTPEIVSH